MKAWEEQLIRQIEIRKLQGFRRRVTEADVKQTWRQGVIIIRDLQDALNESMRKLQNLSSVDKALSVILGPQATNKLMQLEGEAVQALGKAHNALVNLQRYLNQKAR